MRTIWLAGVVGVVSIVSTAYGHAEEVNFSEVNPVLQSLAQAVVAGDDSVDFAAPSFDEEFSSLKLGRLKYDLTGSISQAPWGAKGELKASSTYVVDRTPIHSGITASLQAEVRTDVLALARHAGAVALTKSKGHSPKYEARILSLLGALSKVSSLEALGTLIEAGQALGIEMLDDKIATSGSATPWTEVRAAYQRATVQRLADRIVVETPDTAGFFAHRPDIRFRAGISKVTLSAVSVKADLAVFVQAQSAELDRLKSTLESNLFGAQNGDGPATARVQDAFRAALVAFKIILKGENNY